MSPEHGGLGTQILLNINFATGTTPKKLMINFMVVCQGQARHALSS